MKLGVDIGSDDPSMVRALLALLDFRPLYHVSHGEYTWVAFYLKCWLHLDVPSFGEGAVQRGCNVRGVWLTSPSGYLL